MRLGYISGSTANIDQLDHNTYNDKQIQHDILKDGKNCFWRSTVRTMNSPKMRKRSRHNAYSVHNDKKEVDVTEIRYIHSICVVQMKKMHAFN